MQSKHSDKKELLTGIFPIRNKKKVTKDQEMRLLPSSSPTRHVRNFGQKFHLVIPSQEATEIEDRIQEFTLSHIPY
jgi:hypothetical protein